MCMVLIVRNRIAFQSTYPDDADGEIRKHYGTVLRYLKNMQIDIPAFVRRNSIIPWEPWTTPSSVDTLAVLLQPIADFTQSLCLRWVNFAIGTRTNIEDE